MEKTIIIPENIEEITLGQFQRLDKINTDDEFESMCKKISIITGLVKSDIERANHNDIININSQIDQALSKEGEFKSRFKIGNIEFGLIPNFDKITAKEYMDLSSYGVEVETLHNVIAILYRPIKDNGKTYTIHSYNGTEEYASVMKLIPLSYVNGALGFFLTLQNDLLNYLERYTAQAQQNKQADISKNGVGMQRLTNWLGGKFGNMSMS